jgi:arylsulfatase A-like enzyme
MRKKMRLLMTAALSIAIAGPTYAQSVDRTVLPIADQPFTGRVGYSYGQSTPAFPKPVSAPEGAPNVVLILTDDVGFAAASTFGGPVPTPNLDRLAARGLIYNRFHVTAICSSTRAALLTGRNHHAVAVGNATNVATGYPGYNNSIPKSAATIAEVLRQNGYSTAMFGKNHNTPESEVSTAGPFDRWPTGLGFDYFYGFMSDEADQFRPGLYRNIQRVPTLRDEILDKALADDAITWLHNQDAPGTGRPFFIYYAPGSTHMPHQAPAEWIARFRSAFDQGWDAMRSASAKRQIAKWIVPKGTLNTARPEGIPAWESLSPQQRRIAARFMEAYAGMLAYQDDQIGRVLDEIDRMGKGDNTLVMFIEGDNGAQAGSTPIGSLNPIAGFANGYQETVADLSAALDSVGGPDSLPDYGGGWAWGLSAPFPYFKTFGSHLGGTRSGLVISWPKGISSRGIRSQFTHVNDIMPTILEATGLPIPTSVNGVKQQPLAGVSLAYSFAQASAPERHMTQYFEMFGNRAIYKDGWWANTTPEKFNYIRPPTNIPRDVADYGWELYDLRTDFSQSTDLAARYPAKLAELRAAFDIEAENNNVFPLDDRLTVERFTAQRQQFPARTHYTYWGQNISVGAFRAAPLFGTSFTLKADIEVSAAESGNGTILAYGGKFGGWSFFLKDGKPGALMAASQLDRDKFQIMANVRVKPGRSTVVFTFMKNSGSMPGGRLDISVDGKQVAGGPVGRTISLLPDPTGTLDVGFDGDAPVSDLFEGDARFTGEVRKIDIAIN